MYKIEDCSLEEFFGLCHADIEGGDTDYNYDGYVFKKLTYKDEIICILGTCGTDLVGSFSPIAKRHVRALVSIGNSYLDSLGEELVTLVEADKENLIRFAEHFGFCPRKKLEQIDINDIIYTEYIRKSKCSQH